MLSGRRAWGIFTKDFPPAPSPFSTPPATITADRKTSATFQPGEAVEFFYAGRLSLPTCLSVGAQVHLVRWGDAHWVVERAGREWQSFMANVHPRRTGR